MTQPAGYMAEMRVRIEPLDRGAMERTQARQNTLTKPQVGLGRLEEVSIQLASVTGRPRLDLRALARLSPMAAHPCR